MAFEFLIPRFDQPRAYTPLMTVRRSVEISLAIATLAMLPWGAAGFLFGFFITLTLVNAGALLIWMFRS